MNPKISVIIPVYNTEKYIDHCLRSVFGQTVSDIEIVLVDDVGTDAAMDRVSALKSGCPRGVTMEIRSHETNRGLSAARNTGIAAATGKYLYFLDSDDWLPPECLEMLLVAAEKQSAEICSGNLEYRLYEKAVSPTEQNESSTIFYASNNDVLRMYAHWDVNKIIACNRLLLKSFIVENELFFEKGFGYAEDNLWSYQVAVRASRWVHVNATTYCYRKNNPDSITNTHQFDKILECYYHILDTMCTDLESLNGADREKEALFARIVLSFQKTILWSIEHDEVCDFRALYSQFRRRNRMGGSRRFVRSLGFKERVYVWGWRLPYPFNRFFCPYYLVNKIRSS